MDDLVSMAARLPLAAAVFQVWRHVTGDRELQSLYDRHRGRGYERVLSFPVLVRLIADALLISDASGRESLELARNCGILPTSIQAAYGKLRRIPPEVSEAFLYETTRSLQDLWPKGIVTHELPSCLSDFDVLVLDGKTVKGLHRRLKPLRGAKGGAVGGKALVAMDLRSGLAVSMQTHLDGEANEVRLTPALTQAIRDSNTRRRLWVGDRAFSYIQQVLLLGDGEDAFLVRRRKDITFERDIERDALEGLDENNRRYEETWGWLSRHGMPRAVRVRRITIALSDGESLDLITDLLDGNAFPAAQLLQLYRKRWRIERVFQEVTKVFGLKHLIGSTPQASLFQFAICLLLYNTLQLVRAHIAAGRKQPATTISTEKMFRDARRQLSAWLLLAGVDSTAALSIDDAPTSRNSLASQLGSLWRPRWTRAPTQSRRAPPRAAARGKHVSAQKLIEKDRKRKNGSY